MSHQVERVTAVFEAAVLLEPAERLSFVRKACADDSDLRRQVESMLADVDQPVVVDRPVDEAIADLMDDDRPVVIGRQFGPYRVESLLGVGGMGEVYRATDTVLGRQVAIKILPSDVAADPAWVARFRREAQMLATLNHPNIGAIYGFETLDGHTGSAFGIVLELVEGPTLAETLKAGPLPIDEALAVAQQIAEALDAAHQQGIVHRDLKPGNIKVPEDGTVKVLDFGLAKVAEAPEIAHESAAGVGRRDPSLSPTITTPAMTAAGIILGTAAYMSPEQAKGQPVTKTTDIWAFGCVLYEMLTGTMAFKGDGTADTMALVVGENPIESPAVNPPARDTLAAAALSAQGPAPPLAGRSKPADRCRGCACRSVRCRDTSSDHAEGEPALGARRRVRHRGGRGRLRACCLEPGTPGPPRTRRACARRRVAGEPDRAPAATAQCTSISIGHCVVARRPVARLRRRSARHRVKPQGNQWRARPQWQRRCGSYMCGRWID